MFIDSSLKTYLASMGEIKIDYLNEENYNGFNIRLDRKDSSGNCC